MKVYIHVEQRGERKRIPLPWHIPATMIKKGVITDPVACVEINKALLYYQKRLLEGGLLIANLPCGKLVEYLTEESVAEDKKEAFALPFIKYVQKLNTSDTKFQLCRSVVKHFRLIINADDIDINSITKKTVIALVTEMKESGVGALAIERYISILSAAFNKAVNEYNDPDEGVEVIKRSPFDATREYWRAKAQDKNKSQDNVLSPLAIRCLANATIENDIASMARDAYILSFCLCGANGIDLMKIERSDSGMIEFHRSKTQSRTNEGFVSIKLHKLAVPFSDRQAETGDNGKLWLFHEKYHADSNTFSAVLARGIKTAFDCTAKQYAEENNITMEDAKKVLGIDRQTFYSARHSWATIAANECGVSVDVIEQGLCHAGKNLSDKAYIKKDFTRLNEANDKVIRLVLG